jgi:hypothetical protein
VAGCDSQVTPRYVGESLLSLSGEVTITDDHTQGTLEPALAFENQDLGRLEIMDVASQGKFPSDFSLQVYTPPPSGALVAGPAGEPRYALGYVTAVSAHHRSAVNFAENTVESGSCDMQVCLIDFEACDPHGDSCYRETRRCDVNHKNCVVVATSGDAALGQDPRKFFAGLSANYQVLYLDAAAEADSALAKRFAEGARLSAGYHLLEVRPVSDAEGEAKEECFSTAEAAVLDVYNSAHDTAYEDIYAVGAACARDPKPCSKPGDDTVDELDAQIRARTGELGCWSEDVIYTWVEHPESTSITIRIVPQDEPLSIGPFSS